MEQVQEEQEGQEEQQLRQLFGLPSVDVDPVRSPDDIVPLGQQVPPVTTTVQVKDNYFSKPEVEHQNLGDIVPIEQLGSLEGPGYKIPSDILSYLNQAQKMLSGNIEPNSLDIYRSLKTPTGKKFGDLVTQSFQNTKSDQPNQYTSSNTMDKELVRLAAEEDYKNLTRPEVEHQELDDTVQDTQAPPEIQDQIGYLLGAPPKTESNPETPPTVQEQFAGEETKKVLSKNVEDLAKLPIQRDETGSRFWNYVDSANKANTQPAIINPAQIMADRIAKQNADELEQYRKATSEIQSQVPLGGSEHPDEDLLKEWGDGDPHALEFTKFEPSLGKLPSFIPKEEQNEPFEGLTTKQKKKIGV
jgi:hypothetical protein